MLNVHADRKFNLLNPHRTLKITSLLCTFNKVNIRHEKYCVFEQCATIEKNRNIFQFQNLRQYWQQWLFPAFHGREIIVHYDELEYIFNCCWIQRMIIFVTNFYDKIPIFQCVHFTYFINKKYLEMVKLFLIMYKVIEHLDISFYYHIKH